jgi:HPt (histidine-containing phosphotransfer) domain-containing protein
MTGTLNMEVIDELLALSEDGDPELLADLIQMFLDDGPTKLDAIVQGIAAADWTRVEHAAHALKGSSGNLGAVHVQADCDSIQNACRQQQTASVAGQAQALRQHLQEAETALRDVLQKLTV